MPELPDIVAYIEALERLIQGRAIERIHLKSPFFLRSVSGSRVLDAEHRFSGSFTRRTRRTIVRDVRQGERSWRIAGFPGCSKGIGPVRSRSLNPGPVFHAENLQDSR